MFLLLVGKSIVGRGIRIGTAFAAVALAATVTTALGNLQVSLRGKLEQQLAAFGPNIWIAAPQGSSLSLTSLHNAARQLKLDAAPYVKQSGVSLTVTGITAGSSERSIQALVHSIDPVAQRRMSGWWKVDGQWPTRPGEGMVGVELARTLEVGAGSTLVIGSRAKTGASGKVQVVGVLTSGGEDDSALVMTFATLPGDIPVQGAEVRVRGDEAHIESVADQLRTLFSSANVHVLQRVARADTLVLSHLEEVFGLLGLVIVLAAGLCVSTTFSTMVNQRSQEIGLQKAMGATDSEVVSLFWGEALILGCSGGLLGWLAGMGFAAWIGQSVFQSPVTPQFVVLPLVIMVAVGMTLLAAVPSARRIARIDPAISLKGTRSMSKGI